MNIQAMTCLLVAAVLASLASGGTGDWQAPPPPAGAGDMTAEGYFDGGQGVDLVSAPGAARADDMQHLEELEVLVLRLLRANAERAAAFRRETRQSHFKPNKPSCEGNTCNQRGWKRTFGRRRR